MCCADLQVVGPKADAARIAGIDVQLGDGDTFKFGESAVHSCKQYAHRMPLLHAKAVPLQCKSVCPRKFHPPMQPLAYHNHPTLTKVISFFHWTNKNSWPCALSRALYATASACAVCVWVCAGELEMHVFDTPGHTRGHITYWAPGAKALFPGQLGCASSKR
jgi:hypothetical protein